MGRNHTGRVQKAKLYCAACRRTKKDGVEIKTCYGCRQVYYCSVQCERNDWSSHHEPCVKHANKVFGNLIKAFMVDPVLKSKLKLALVEECSYGSRDLVRDVTAFTRQTHIVAVFMGVEPTNTREAVSSWAFGNKWNYKGVESMLQVNRLSSHARDRYNGGTDVHIGTKNVWAAYRADADKRGHAANAVILTLFRDPAYNYDISVPMMIEPNTLKTVQDRTRGMSADDLEISIDSQMLDINNHIRVDIENQLRLRLPLRKGDKNLILSALNYDNLEDDPDRDSVKSFELSVVRVKILSGDFLPEIDGTEDIAARERLLDDTSFPSVRDKIAALFRLCMNVE